MPFSFQDNKISFFNRILLKAARLLICPLLSIANLFFNPNDNLIQINKIPL